LYPSCSDADFTVFDPLVFKLLKLYFTAHPLGNGRTLLDTTPEEANEVAGQTGLHLYSEEMHFMAENVQVSQAECKALLEQLCIKVADISREPGFQDDGCGHHNNCLFLFSAFYVHCVDEQCGGLALGKSIVRSSAWQTPSLAEHGTSPSCLPAFTCQSCWLVLLSHFEQGI